MLEQERLERSDCFQDQRREKVSWDLEDGARGSGCVDGAGGCGVGGGGEEERAEGGVEERDAGGDFGAADDEAVEGRGEDCAGEGDEAQQRSSVRRRAVRVDERGETDGHRQRRAHRQRVALEQRPRRHRRGRVAVEVVDQRVLALVQPRPQHKPRRRLRHRHHPDADRPIEGHVARHPEGPRDPRPCLGVQRRVDDAFGLPQGTVRRLRPIDDGLMIVHQQLALLYQLSVVQQEARIARQEHAAIAPAESRLIKPLD
eukprot:2842487-Rhodomonas_salina.1